jgi:hypothetical protein
MTDFGISHLAVGQAHILGRRVEPGAWLRRHVAVPVRRITQGNGVVIATLALTPSIEDAEHHGPGSV